MNNETTNEKIKRAWILIQANVTDIDDVAERIRELNVKLLNEKDHIVRADTVSGSYNIVVPVFAENDSQMDFILGLIANETSVSKIEVLRVKESTHHPDPPHDATGYITKDEAGASNLENKPPPGTTGWNTWG